MWDKLLAFLETTFSDYLLPIGLTIILTLVALKLINVVIDKIEPRVIGQTKDGQPKDDQDADRIARLRTLFSTIKTTCRVTVLSLSTLTVLTTLGIDIAPLIAAAGVAGLAITLGAQTLIKDFFGGMMILVEDQFRVGDWISVSGVDGTVEKVTLRRTNVRASDGTLFVVPNGDVRVVGNATREWSRAVVELNLPFDADIEKAVSVLSAALEQAAHDPDIAGVLLAPPEIMGWNQANDWSLRVRMQAKVKPGQHWRVARVLRRRALEALSAANIPVARPLDSVSVPIQAAN